MYLFTFINIPLLHPCCLLLLGCSGNSEAACYISNILLLFRFQSLLCQGQWGRGRGLILTNLTSLIQSDGPHFSIYQPQIDGGNFWIILLSDWSLIDSLLGSDSLFQFISLTCDAFFVLGVLVAQGLLVKALDYVTCFPVSDQGNNPCS